MTPGLNPVKYEIKSKVKKTGWIILFVVVLLIDLAAVYFKNEILRSVTKPLLMPLLIIYFVSAANPFVSSLKKWILLALGFSWLGDVLLIGHEAEGPISAVKFS